MSDREDAGAIAVPVRRVGGGEDPRSVDAVVVEEPLEIRVEGAPFAVTMRTPGHDLELAAGFLFGEGVIEDREDLVALGHIDDPRDPRGNTVDVRLAPGVPLLLEAARARVGTSACGVCGKSSIEQIFQKVPPLDPSWAPGAELLRALPAALRDAQPLFARTGGLHAAALVSRGGALELVREDVGRHNAVDKLIGRRLLDDAVPVRDHLLLVSGRAGFEIVQKAAMARVPTLVAIGAPSSLAVALAQRVGMTLIGFLRGDRYTIYAEARAS